MDCGLEESARRMAKWGDPLGFLAANHYLHLPIIAEKSTMKTHTTLLFCALSFWGVAQSTDFINVAPALGLQDSIGVFAYSGGVSFADFDGDGYDDLTVATGEGLPVLFYRNDGVGGFEQLPALVDNTGEVKMALWADYDNDGDRDLLLTCTASPNRLYRNEGDLVLVDVTEAAGLPLTDDLSWGATFGDYDNDGRLDLYYVNRQVTEHTNYLFRNLGDGTFVDVTAETGVSDGMRPTFCATFLDVNHDSYPDLYLANDKISPNSLFRNNGQGQFDDISVASGAGIVIDAMNADAADFDGDGDLDIYVTNTPTLGNALLRNNGDETFTEVAESCGVGFFAVSWAGLFFDRDNDQDIDLYVCCSTPGADSPNLLFDNQNDGTFSEAFPGGFPGDTLASFSAALGDYNADGRLDVFVPNGGGSPFLLWENRSDEMLHWLKIDLEGVQSNREGIGSWIELYLNGQRWVRYTHCGQGYLSQNTFRQHFGLGAETMADSVIVRWPSGTVDRLLEVPADQVVKVVEGSTVSSVISLATPDVQLGFPQPNPAVDFVEWPVELTKALEVEWRLIDASGRVWVSRQETLPAGRSDLQCSVADLTAGLYTWCLFADGREWSRKIAVR